MGQMHPEPGDYAINEVESADVPSGSKATFTFRTENTGTEAFVPEVAVTKTRNTSYEVKLDGSTRYEAEIPPTDIDDSTQTWFPPVRFSDELTVVVRNFSESTKTYHCQPKGWETSQEGP